jgi:hypothetical protein
MRAAIVSLIVGLGTTAAAYRPSMAWPLRARVSDLAGRPVAFRAITLGGELVFQPSGTGAIRRLARRDTLSATTPAQYVLDLKDGPVVFFVSGRDSIRVVVGRNPLGSDPVTAQGRRLSVRLVNDKVVIDAR